MDSDLATRVTDCARRLDSCSCTVLRQPLQGSSGQQVNAKEHTPLLGAQSSNGCSVHHYQDTQDLIPHLERPVLEAKSKSSLHIFLMCLGIGGLQMAWATELSNGSPYLLSLGMSKSWLAMVWVAGPLSGVLVQPIVGRMSDTCRVSWGRRRPYMLAGAAATVLSLLALAWSAEIVDGFMKLFNMKMTKGQVSKVAIGFAVVWVYILDFSVNTLQASIRAFIVDNSPAQEDLANAWASRIVGFGNILLYSSGYVDLPSRLPFFGDTQFKVLCAVSCVSLIVTVSVSCFCVQEIDPRIRWPSSRVPNRNSLDLLKDCATSLPRLSPQIRKVCMTQFFSWMGWFPFLFYITTYIGQLHLNPLFEQEPHMNPDEINKAWEEATRFGSFALLLFAIVSFTACSLVPLLIRPLNKSHCVSSYREENKPAGRLLSNHYLPYLTIRRAWFLAHLTFCACMLSTILITTPTAAACMTGIAGLSWAMTLWAPFAIISRDISKREALQLAQENTFIISEAHRVSRVTDGGTSAETHLEPITSAKTEEPVENQAGIVLGLHNVAISAPQIISTIISSIIFRLMQRERGTAGDDSVGWVLRFGGLVVLVAAWRTLRIEEEEEPDESAEEQNILIANGLEAGA